MCAVKCVHSLQHDSQFVAIYTIVYVSVLNPDVIYTFTEIAIVSSISFYVSLSFFFLQHDTWYGLNQITQTISASNIQYFVIFVKISNHHQDNSAARICFLQTGERKRKNDDDKHWHYTLNKLTTHCIPKCWVAVIGWLVVFIVQLFRTPFLSISLVFHLCMVFFCFFTHTHTNWIGDTIDSEASNKYSAFCDISIFYAANG